jgi:hypothetical protein
MPPDAVLALSSRGPGQHREHMPGVWHSFCSLPSIEACIGHVWHREAVAQGPRHASPVDLPQGSHSNS